jgi:hypothetical protein
MKAVCEHCGGSYERSPVFIRRSVHHYCSRPCSFAASRERRGEMLTQVGQGTRFQPGHVPVADRNLPTGEAHPAWKGDAVGYVGLHNWVRRVKGTPQRCSRCSKPRTTPRSIQWANIDGKYRRDPADYVALCASCHKLYDLYRTHSG